MARHGDGLYLRGQTWCIDCQGRRNLKCAAQLPSAGSLGEAQGIEPERVRAQQTQRTPLQVHGQAVYPRACRDAGLSGIGLSLHSLRHTFASRLGAISAWCSAMAISPQVIAHRRLNGSLEDFTTEFTTAPF